jgi:hypothetical protein
MGGTEAQPFTLTLDTAQTAFTIGKGGKYIFGTSTYPKMNTKANYYRLVKAGESDNALLAPTTGEAYGRKVYGKAMAEDNSIFISNATYTAFVDLKDNDNAVAIIEKCKNILGENNTIYYTSLDAESAAAAGSNIVDKDGTCKVMNINNSSAYYIPEEFTAASVTYTDANSTAEEILPIMLPFEPSNDITTATPSEFGKVDGVYTLTLAYTDFAKNTPMFVVAKGESITATASNVTIEVSSKDAVETDYLLASYVGTSYKIGTYLQGNNKYTKTTQAGTLLPFAMNIKALPGSTNTASTIVLYYDETTGIEEIETDGEEQDIYDLTGRKIEKITAPGIYIINKKKVIVKNVK